MLHDAVAAIPPNRSMPQVSSACSDPVAVIREILALPEAALDYAAAKLAFDRIVDPSIDARPVQAQLDDMVTAARELAGPAADDATKLSALRALLYQGGPWNGSRPFVYDHADFKELRLKTLPHYLATRRGNCVSMPILFLILADRLGLEVGLARAPSHLFVRHHGPDGRITNLETTSGALPARDIWMRQTRGIDQRGIDSGLYMRSLSRREGVGSMALTVIEHLMEQQRFREAIDVAQVLLRNDQTDAFSLAHQGQAYFQILRSEFLDKYGAQWFIPVPLRGQYSLLLKRNHDAMRAAQELGWKPTGPAIKPDEWVERS